MLDNYTKTYTIPAVSTASLGSRALHFPRRSEFYCQREILMDSCCWQSIGPLSQGVVHFLSKVFFKFLPDMPADVLSLCAKERTKEKRRRQRPLHPPRGSTLPPSKASVGSVSQKHDGAGLSLHPLWRRPRQTGTEGIRAPGGCWGSCTFPPQRRVAAKEEKDPSRSYPSPRRRAGGELVRGGFLPPFFCAKEGNQCRRSLQNKKALGITSI